MFNILIWFFIVACIVIINTSNKKKKTTPNTTNSNSGNTTHTPPVQTQKPVQRTTDTTRTTSSTPNKAAMAKKKKQLQEHFGMPTGRIHEEVHNETHVHDENSTLCRANMNTDNPEPKVVISIQESIDNSKTVLPDTETLIVCGYDGREFLDSLQK